MHPAPSSALAQLAASQALLSPAPQPRVVYPGGITIRSDRSLRRRFQISGRQWRRYEKRNRQHNRMMAGRFGGVQEPSLRVAPSGPVARLERRELTAPTQEGRVRRVTVVLRGGYGRR